MEAYLVTVADAVRKTYALAGDAAVMGAMASRGGGFADLQMLLLLPATDVLSFVSFLYAGSLYAPGDQLVISAFNQVQDVVSTVESLSALLQVEQTVHWAGHKERKLVLTDAFRSLVRSGDVNVVTATGPSKRHLFLFTDMLMFGAAEAGEGGTTYGIDKTVSLATANIKALENAGVTRNAFSLLLGDGDIKFSCTNAVERDSWVNDIQRCITAASTDSRAGSGTVDTITAVTDAAGAAERIKQRLAVKAAITSLPPPPPAGAAGGLPPPPPAFAAAGTPPPPATGGRPAHGLPPPPGPGAPPSSSLPPPPPSAGGVPPPPGGEWQSRHRAPARRALRLPTPPPPSPCRPAGAPRGSMVPPPPGAPPAGGLPPPPSSTTSSPLPRPSNGAMSFASLRSSAASSPATLPPPPSCE
jgi:hypothetical protein